MSASTDAAEIDIGYLRRSDPKSTLSLIQTPANNDGIAGARLAIDDNNTTGRFLNQQFSLEDVPLAGGANAAAGTIAPRSAASRWWSPTCRRTSSSMPPTQGPHARYCFSLSARATTDRGRKTAAPTSFIPLQHD